MSSASLTLQSRHNHARHHHSIGGACGRGVNYETMESKIMNLSHTIDTGLTLKYFDVYNVTLKKQQKFWQHVDADGRQVGPFYPTKAEALSHTTEYANAWMGIK